MLGKIYDDIRKDPSSERVKLGCDFFQFRGALSEKQYRVELSWAVIIRSLKRKQLQIDRFGKSIAWYDPRNAFAAGNRLPLAYLGYLVLG